MNSQEEDEEDEEEDNEDAEVAAEEEAEDEEQADTSADASVDDDVRGGGLASKKTRSLSKSPGSSEVLVRFPPDVIPFILCKPTWNPALFA